MFRVIIGPVWALVFAFILAVLLGIAGPWLAAQEPFPQYGRKPAVDKGPRALGLVQLLPSGKKGRLIPIVIMLDGKYYDAGSYKAAPVPMALDFDTVYEAFRTGVSLGTFTITQPGQLNHVWIAEGTWLQAGAKAAEKRKKYSAPVIADDENDGRPVLHRRKEKSDSDSGGDSKGKKDDDAPPVLHRPSDSDSGSDSKDADKSTDKDKNKDQQKPATAPASPTGAPPASAPPTPDTGKSSAPPESSKASASDENISDPNRPKLRRGKPDPSARHEPFTTFDELADTKAGAAPAGVASSGAGADAKTAKDPAASPPVVLIPAISDAGGPEARPYTYDLKPAEEAIYRNKMLDLAAAQLGAQASATAKDAATSTGKKASTSKPAGKSAGKLAKPVFDDVSLRVFDLSNSNEPVLVLSAKTHPAAVGDNGTAEEAKEITLIARTNLEGELRKLFFSQTDSRHLDMSPRMELVDAVDVDGDGRGELLFRRTFDEGSAYAIYRVTPDRLWPLFEGTP